MPSSPANDEPPADARPIASEADEPPQASSEATAEAAEVAALRDELARAQDRHRRALADLDNYRKRMEREGDRRAAEARQALLRDWLEAVDSVERALRLEPGDPGLIAVLEQMDAILARYGIARLDVVGARFDPEQHEAIAVRPAVDVPDQTVLEVARSGFGLDDGATLRPAQVVVGRRPTGEG
jgi:molecular chaperone GrpE